MRVSDARRARWRGCSSAAALALIWGTAASADAASHTFEGEITGDPKAVVELEVQRNGLRRVVTGFTVRKFPLECDGGTGARLQRASLAGRARVTRNGRFSLAASNATEKLRVEGRLGAGGRARGRVEYMGLTEFADTTRECEANGLRWSATR